MRRSTTLAPTVRPDPMFLSPCLLSMCVAPQVANLDVPVAAQHCQRTLRKQSAACRKLSRRLGILKFARNHVMSRVRARRTSKFGTLSENARSRPHCNFVLPRQIAPSSSSSLMWRTRLTYWPRTHLSRRVSNLCCHYGARYRWNQRLSCISPQHLSLSSVPHH